MKECTVLMTGCGAPGAPGIIRCLRKNGERDIRIVAVDRNENAGARDLVDAFYTVPSAEKEDFLPAVLDICRRESVQIVIPIVTRELMKFARARAEFEALGAKVSVMEPDKLEIVNNKAHLLDAMRAHGLRTPEYRRVHTVEKLKTAVSAAVSLLAGIPSVVYGLVGMLVLVPGIRQVFHIPDGSGLLAAIIVLAIMILPSIINVAMTALEAVPREYEDASLALGATATETWFKVSVPAARSGIAAAVVLGVGRAIGEAMAVMMVSGNVPNMPSLFQSVRFLTTAVASEMGYAAAGLQRQALFSIALVLFLFIMLINAALNFFLKRSKEK